MKKLKLLLTAFALLGGVISANAQTDVTSTYLTNAGFDDCTAETSDVTAKVIVNYSSDGWTKTSSGDFTTIAVTAYGGGVKVGGSTTPSTKKDGSTVAGNTLGIIAGWGDNVTIQSNDITLPAGVYTLSVDHYLTSSTNNYGSTSSKFGFVTSGSSYLVSSTTFSASTWTTETVTFTLTESTTGKIQIGLTGLDKSGSGSPAVFYDDVTLTKYSDDDLRSIHGLTSANYAAPVVTDFVVNGTFDSNINGWSRTGSFSNNQRQTGKSAPFNGGFYENWNKDPQANKMYQTISNIPNGTYRLDIAAFVNILASPNTSQYVFANSDKTYLTAAGDPPVEYEVYTVVTTNQIEIGLEQTTATANWMAMDNVSLRYYGAGDVINDAKNAAHKLAWEEARDAAIAARDNASYTNVGGSERAALLAEIAKLEPSTADGYDAAAADLTSATSTFTAAKINYDIFATYNTTLTYADSDKKPTITGESTAATILPALRAYYESNALAEGDATVIDYTSHLTNYNNPSNTTGWTINNTTGNSSMRTMSSESYTDADGTNSHSYFDSNSWGSAFATTFTQNVTLPAGKYLFTAKARGNGTTTYKVIAGEEGTDITAIGNTGGVFDRGWNDYSVEFTVASEGAVALGIQMETGSSSNWLSFGNFRLMKINNTLAEAIDYTNLNTAISTADAKTLGFEDGGYAPYANAAALAKLAEAKAINQSANNERSVVQGLTTYLNTAGNWHANDGDVDAIYNGMFATVAEGQNYPDGWTRTNAWGQMKSDISGTYSTAYYNQPGSLQYGNQGIYTMPLAENTAYALTFAYRSHENNSNNKMTISVLKESDGLPAMTFAGNGSTTDWKVVTKNFKTGAAGNYILTLANDGNTWITNVSLVKAGSKDETIEISAAGFATYVSDVDLDFSLASSIEAYKVKVSTKGVATLTKVDEVPAGTPVLLYADGSATEDIPVMTGAAAVGENDLVAGTGATVATTDGEYTNMILNNVDDNIGFYFANGKTVAKYRAYLHIATTLAPDTEASSRMVMVFADEATGISTVKDAGSKVDGYYDLQGRRVTQPAKGLYIVNGKKVVIK